MSDDEFRLRPPEFKVSENDVERGCLDLLRYHRYWPVRLQSGKFIMPDRAVIEALRRVRVTPRWISLGEPGIPDYVIPQFFVETKRPGGGLSQVQRAKILELRRDWDLETAVVESVDELIEWLNHHPKV